MTATQRSERRAERKAQEARVATAKAATAAVVATGCCPHCGAKLRRNWSLTGWWQCEQFGAVGFRKDPNKAACEWQGFV
jgi:hypothetical protein